MAQKKWLKPPSCLKPDSATNSPGEWGAAMRTPSHLLLSNLNGYSGKDSAIDYPIGREVGRCVRSEFSVAKEGEATVRMLCFLATATFSLGCATTYQPFGNTDPVALSINSQATDIQTPLAPTPQNSADIVALDAEVSMARLEAQTLQLSQGAVEQASRAFNPYAIPAVALASQPDFAVANVDDAAQNIRPSDDVLSTPAEPLPPPAPLSEPTLRELLSSDLADSPQEVNLDTVIDSVYRSYPLLEAAVQQRTIAAGVHLAASGEFDLMLRAASENNPVGFYENYRQRVGIVQPRYRGGDVFAGYRIGRGTFEPWYKERETNEGGEFRTALTIPLARDRQIDQRRADLWRANVGRQVADPEINAQLIDFVQEASYAYWDWVASGEKLRIAKGILALAEDRAESIRRQVEEDALDPPVLTDNLRLIAERRASRASAERKLRQAAVKLSLYFRTANGRPLIPDDALLPGFPPPVKIEPESIAADISTAITQRPEAVVLSMMIRQLEIDFAQASNEFRPSIDAVVGASQDVGTPASAANDKGDFELDTSLYLDMPVQRRKARGRMQVARGKITQLAARRRLVEDRIAADVQSVYAALVAAYEQVEQTRQAVEFAEDLATRERRSLQLGAADLLTVAFREQFAVEAADRAVDALLLYFLAEADYRAAMAQDQLP